MDDGSAELDLLNPSPSDGGLLWETTLQPNHLGLSPRRRIRMGRFSTPEPFDALARISNRFSSALAASAWARDP
jgi:hypothetical protein